MRLRGFLVAALALASAACNVGPKYVKPAAPVPAAFKEPLPENFKEAPGWKLGQPEADMHHGKWWELFGDPDLNALEEQIAVSNQTLAAAEAQFRGARAAIRVARSGLYPSFSGSASVLGAGTSGNLGRGVAGQTPLLTIPSVGASWEPDLWGQIHNSIEANTAEAQATAAELANVKLSLQAELALDYFQLHGLDAQKQLLDDTAQAYQRALVLTTNRYQQGIASQVDVTQAQTQLAQTQAESTDTLVLRRSLEHAIAILLGKPPSGLSIPGGPIKVDVPPIPGVVPSGLLERRPDIAANERRVAAANADIGIAITAFYPTLNLSASGGFESGGLASLFTWPSRFWSVGPNIAQIFFDAGRRRGLTEEAQASYDAQVANYRQSVLTAFQQVEDELSELRTLETEAQQQSDAVNYAEHSLQLANAQYQGGIATYLQVISAQEIALSNEVTAVRLKTRKMTAAVSLIEALGGGWSTSDLPSPQEVTPRKPPKVAALSDTK